MDARSRRAEEPKVRPRRALRVLAHGGRIAFWMTTFTGALAGGVSLHGTMPAFRRAAADIGNRVLAGRFAGEIVITDVQSLSIGKQGTLRAKHVEVIDPDGKHVIGADDLEASIDLYRLATSLTFGQAPSVAISNVRLARADVVLETGPDGTSTIASAFRSRIPAPPPGPAPAAGAAAPPPPPAPFVDLTSIRIDHAHVHGNLVPPSLDGELDDVSARLKVEDRVAHIALDKGKVTLRAPQAPNQKAPIVGMVTGNLDIELVTIALSGKADLAGSCGELPLVAHAEIDKGVLSGSLDITPTEPRVVATAFSDIPVTKPIEIHAKVRGVAKSITIEARTRIGTSRVDANGEIDLHEGRPFKLDLDAEHVDATAFGASVTTDLSGKLHGEGMLGGEPLGTFRVSTTAGSVNGEPVPPAIIEGHFEDRRVTATVRASEPGIEANGKIVVDIPEKVASFDIQARSSSLRSLARAPGVIHGAASARVQGKVDLDKATVRATTNVAGENVATGAFSARHLNASGTIAGPLRAPVIQVGFAGVDMHVQANGKAPLVYPTATGQARVALTPSPHLIDASVNLGGADGVTASASAVRFANGEVETRGLHVTGLGEPLELDARVGNGQWSVHAKSNGVDLARVGALTGIAELKHLPRGSHATMDVDIHQTANGPSGHFDVVVHSNGLLGASTVVAEAHGTVDRGKLAGRARVAADGLGQIEITQADLDLPDRLDAKSLRRTTGTIELRGAIDLSQGGAMFAGPEFERIAGVASFDARIERGDPDALPALRGTVRTQGLEVVLASESSTKATTFAGVDVVTHVAWDGRTEDAEIALVSWDEHGLLGSASAKAKVPALAWATGAKKLDLEAVSAIEIDATADVPARQLAELPAFLDIPILRGKVDGRFHFAGTLEKPQIMLSGKTHRLRVERSAAASSSFSPLDGTLEARWDGERGVVTFGLDERLRLHRRATLRGRAEDETALPPDETNRARATKPLGHLRGLVLLSDLRLLDFLRGRRPSTLPWSASAEVEVENIAIGALPLPGAVTGIVSGRARLKELNREPSFEAKAHIDGLAVNGATLGNTDVNVGGRDASLFAHAAAASANSKVTLQLASQSLRVKGLDASWNAEAPTRVDYAVENGRLAVLRPLLRQSVSDIDGRVDGTGSMTVDATSQVFEGGLAVQGARLYVNVLGEEITSLAATARFDRTGTFRIDDATGKMGSGEFRASATGRMQGLKFIGGEATIVVPKDSIPLSSESATFAEATGEVKVTATMAEDRSALNLAIDVPHAGIQLPDRSTQSLESLDPDPTVTVGVRRPNGKLDTAVVRKGRGGTGQTKRDALAMRIAVTLGNEVELQGRGLDIKLGGKTVVELTDELSVTGRIDLRGGTIEVHGRSFQVDRGVVNFPEGGDPSNPTIVAAAYWDAPDRTRVWVEFAGPLKSRKLTLRSEPPYGTNEILSVLLFGRPDPNMASSGGTANKSGDASGATAVGSGFIAGDLNRMLSEIDEDLDVETDTLSGNRMRAKIGHSFFDRRLKVQVGIAPGQTYREPDSTFVFLNWQIIPKWSIVATRGNKGTSILDVLFQHRY